jgi:hypothetical protein
MRTKHILMFVAVALLVGTIVSMTTTSGAFAARTTENSSNSSNNNSNTNNNNNNNNNNCQDNNSAGDNGDSATAAASDSENGATDDADEQGDNDVNDQEDTDTGNEDAGEANDQEQSGDGTTSTSSNDNAKGANDQFPLPKFDSCNFGNEIIDNPYFTLTPGTTFTYKTITEDNETEKDIVIVTDKTKEILGITTTVVWDRVWLEEELTEETFDWYAQDKEGNVWYMGEDSKEYENGKVVSTEGSWEAGVDGAKPGIIMEADPQVGDSYRQEYYPGHAEDQAEVVSLNEKVEVPFGTFTNCLQTRESTPLEPTQDEDKYYCTDVGGVTLEVAIDSGEKTELIDFEQSDGAASTSANDNGATDDADEQGDNDVNDQEDTDTGNEDAGEANDEE